MFGYISINKQEMKYKDFDVYHSFYCGFCRELKERYGRRGQMTLSYDMTFLLMLLTGLYEPQTELSCHRCVVHPIGKHPTRSNEYTKYVADMNILLSYYKLKDDWHDDKKRTRYVYAKMLEKSVSAIREEHPQTAALMAENLSIMSNCERENEQDLDKMAGYFGQIMGQMFAYKEDEWKECLYRLGFFLGKFIYLMDAYEDIEEDIKRERYNPLLSRWQHAGFDEECRELLTLMMAECSKAFEKLPIIEYTDILRNVLYSGVWCRFEQVRTARAKPDAKMTAVE